MTTRVVILGAGFGGLELASRLSADVPGLVEVTLIDQADAFVFGFSKLDVMFGRSTLDQIRLPYSAIDKPSVRFVQETILSIDPVARTVRTTGGTHAADVLVVALGADLLPQRTEGFLECGYEFYSPEGAARVGELLPGFSGGDVVIGVLGGHFKCPPAPYECAFMLHDHLTRRGLRERSTIHLVTPMPRPIPASREASTAIIEGLDERGITHWHGAWLYRCDPQARVARLRDQRTVGFDLFLGIPKHVAPKVVVESGLTGEDGWIPVDPATLETPWPGVFAVGDITSATVPKAGLIAEGEATTVAEVIIHRLGAGPMPPPYPGLITCYVEMGDDLVGRVDVDFRSGPRPTSLFMPPSLEGVEQKREFASSRIRRWFGLDG